MSVSSKLVLDKRTEERLKRNPTNLWSWYEAAKSIEAIVVTQLLELATELGIALSRDVEEAINKGFKEYNVGVHHSSNDGRTDCTFDGKEITCTRCGWWHLAISVERAFALLGQHRRGEFGMSRCIGVRR